MDARLAELCRAALAATQKQARLIDRRPPDLPADVVAGALRTGLPGVERAVAALGEERERRRGSLYPQLAPIAEAQAIVRELPPALAAAALDDARACYDRLERKLDAVLLIAER